MCSYLNRKSLVVWRHKKKAKPPQTSNWMDVCSKLSGSSRWANNYCQDRRVLTHRPTTLGRNQNQNKFAEIASTDSSSTLWIVAEDTAFRSDLDATLNSLCGIFASLNSHCPCCNALQANQSYSLTPGQTFVMWQRGSGLQLVLVVQCTTSTSLYTIHICGGGLQLVRLIHFQFPSICGGAPG